jgi:heavy metal translocating P-type ATPase
MSSLVQPATTEVPSQATTPDRHPNAAEHGSRVELGDAIRIGLVAIAAVLVWFHVWEPFPRISIIGIAATLIGGYPIFKEAVENIIERRMTMELSMTIALVSALVIREFFTALVIALFVLIAEVLEGLTVDRGRRAIRDLLDFLPQTANLMANGEGREVPISSIQKSDVVLVKPGSRIPVDGIVLGGDSFVDQSAITGEPMPVRKTEGTSVYAGTINQSGALNVRVEKLGRDTSFGRIIEAVEQAERSRAPIQKTADRLAGYLVYFALAAAVVTFLLTHNMRSTISVVIVAGACGIAAGTPLAILGAIGRAATEGAIIKGGRHLESLASVDTIVLDKTGTLTFGTPQIEEVLPADGFTEHQVITAASIAERRSEHPLAKAVLERADQLGIPAAEPETFEYTPGKGIVASYNDETIVIGSRAFISPMWPAIKNWNGYPQEGTSEFYVARAGSILGRVRVADVLRPEAIDAIAALQQIGLRTVLLSGDARNITQSIGKALGVDEAQGELMPDQKADWGDRLRNSKRYVAMLGDGINDAPALARANVGVAMGSGTDATRESADVVLIGNDLSKFVETIRIARKCKSIIMQNFYGTLMVDTTGIVLAAVGLLNPLLAAFIHVSSEMIFILNSTRMLPSRNVLT